MLVAAVVVASLARPRLGRLDRDGHPDPDRDRDRPDCVILGLVFGTNRRTIRFVGIFVAVAVLLYVVAHVGRGHRRHHRRPESGGGNGRRHRPRRIPTVIVGLGGIGVVLALIAHPHPHPAVDEPGRPGRGRAGRDPDHRSRRGTGPGPDAARRRRRHGTPVDAMTAYLALVDDLDADRRSVARPSRRHRPNMPGACAATARATSASTSWQPTTRWRRSVGSGLPAREDRRAVPLAVAAIWARRAGSRRTRGSPRGRIRGLRRGGGVRRL